MSLTTGALFFALILPGTVLAAPAVNEADPGQAERRSQAEMVERMQQMELMDRMAMEEYLDEAGRCARNNDYSGAEKHLAKAARLAADNRDRLAVAAARDKLNREQRRRRTEAAKVIPAPKALYSQREGSGETYPPAEP